MNVFEKNVVMTPIKKKRWQTHTLDDLECDKHRWKPQLEKLIK